MHMFLIVLELCSSIMSHRFTDFTVGRDILMIFIYISVYICPHTLFLSCFLLFIPIFVFALFTHPFFCFCLRSVGDGAGSSRFSAGAFAMRSSSGSSVDPHAVSVRCAGGMWHGLPRAEEVYPPGPGSQVGC